MKDIALIPEALENGTYSCSKSPTPPTDNTSIDYGYCRYSLELQPTNTNIGHFDTKCSRYCPHKAPISIARLFSANYSKYGNKYASTLSKRAKDSRDKEALLMSDKTSSLTKLYSKPNAIIIGPNLEKNLIGL